MIQDILFISYQQQSSKSGKSPNFGCLNSPIFFIPIFCITRSEVRLITGQMEMIRDKERLENPKSKQRNAPSVAYPKPWASRFKRQPMSMAGVNGEGKVW